MPPEAIEKSVFTPAGDVWSYGVTLWEMFSFGDKPWEGFSLKQVGRVPTLWSNTVLWVSEFVLQSLLSFYQVVKINN